MYYRLDSTDTSGRPALAPETQETGGGEETPPTPDAAAEE